MKFLKLMIVQFDSLIRLNFYTRLKILIKFKSSDRIMKLFTRIYIRDYFTRKKVTRKIILNIY